MNYLSHDMIQLISQYCSQVYCVFRLVSKEWKNVIDEILPSGSVEQKVCFLQGAHCGWKLLDKSDFDAWLDALDRVYGNEGISGETVEKFCRDYQRNAKNESVLPRIAQNVLHVLCKYNRMDYVKGIWNSMEDRDEGVCCDWMKEVGMLDDLEFVSMVHLEFLKHCKDNVNDIIRRAIQGAVDCYQWKNITYLFEKHAEMYNDEELNRNSRFVFAAIDQDIFKNDILLQKDRKVVLEAVKRDGWALQYVDDSLTKNKEILLQAVRTNGFALQYADDSFKKEKEVVLEAVKQDGFALQYVDDSLRKDKEVVMAAVKTNGYALQHAEFLSKDKEVVIAAVKTDGYALQFADDSLRKDKEVVMEAVKDHGRVLEWADDSLKKDKDVVMAAVKSNGILIKVEVLKYADDSLRKDKEVVMAAVQQDGIELKYADDSLRKDKEVVMAAVKNDGRALKYADYSLIKDKEVVLTAVKDFPNASKYADSSLKKEIRMLTTSKKDK